MLQMKTLRGMATDLMCALGDSDLNTHLWYNLGNFKNNEYLGIIVKSLKYHDCVSEKNQKKKKKLPRSKFFSIIHLIYL